VASQPLVGCAPRVMAGAVDELWPVKNAFYVGVHQQAISEAMNNAPSSDAGRAERDFFMYRAYSEQGQTSMVLNELASGNKPAPLQSAYLLALYLSGSKEAAVAALKERLAAPGAASEASLQLVAALIYAHEQEYKDALKLIHQSTDLETIALCAHIYIAMNRLDYARKMVDAMQRQDDDATLTKLANAWVSIAEGGGKYQEAIYEFQEMGENYQLSLPLTNGMALANLHMGKYEEAERLLQDALAKSASDADTLANMVVTMQYLRKPPEIINRYIAQLRAAAPAHPWIAKYSELESAFDRCAAQMGGA